MLFIKLLKFKSWQTEIGMPCFMKKVDKNHFIGCLLGGAIGDALGAPIEFMHIDQIRAKYGQNGVKNFVEYNNNVGAFTDDTQMTLFTAEALIRADHRVSQKGITGALKIIAYNSYKRWLLTQENNFTDQNEQLFRSAGNGWLIQQSFLYQRRAPGTTCISALRSGLAGTMKKPINNSKGCGTIMRVAPVGLKYFGENEKAFKIACELSAITHGHPTGILSAGFFASVIADLAVKVTLEKAIGNAMILLKNYKNHEETLKAAEDVLDLFAKTKSNPKVVTAETVEQLGEGWIAEESLAISLYTSLIFENDFEKGVLLAVNHSGDCDSTGSITGNILGIIHGIKAIPKKWVTNLRNHDFVQQIAEDLYIQIIDFDHILHEEWLKKYPGD